MARRLPKTGGVLFTIRTYIRPLSEFTSRPEVCGRLAAAISAMPQEAVNYKSMIPTKEIALAWLQQQAATAEKSSSAAASRPQVIRSPICTQLGGSQSMLRSAR